MSDKDFCIKLLNMAKELNDMAENVIDNNDQYDICVNICDRIIDKYNDYKMKYNM